MWVNLRWKSPKARLEGFRRTEFLKGRKQILLMAYALCWKQMKPLQLCLNLYKIFIDRVKMFVVSRRRKRKKVDSIKFLLHKIHYEPFTLHHDEDEKKG